MIQKYSTLQHIAETESEKKQLPKMLELFANKAKNIPDKVFDPDVVTVDIQRWQYAKRQNKSVKPIEQYKDHVELHEAMRNYLSEKELELHNQKTRESNITEGSQVLFSEGKYKVYEASTPHALSELSKPSRWCVQNVSAADEYLKKRGDFQIVHKDNKPLYAITQEEVWYFTNYELRNGKNYSGNQSTPYILKEDFDYLNKVLKQLGNEPVSVQSLTREDLVVVNNVAEIQQRVDKALQEGDSSELQRALLNMRDFNIQLPENITIKGDLDLEGTNLLRLPKGLTVTGSLNLKETKIQKLPKGLSVEGHLHLEGCTGLTSLPEGLSVEGHLHLEGCTGLTSLSGGLSVGGHLDLTGCTRLTSLPEGLSVGGHLYLEGCTGLTSLSEGISVGGHLDLTGCTRLTSLPEGLSVKKNLILSGCTGLTFLPEKLSVSWNLNLNNCTGLISLPEIFVGGELDLTGCTALRYLPEKLFVGSYLNLTGCTGLTSLPPGLSINSLDLEGCTGLTSLPKGLSVKGYLDLEGCTGLTSLPEGLSVAELNLTGCTGLISLPERLSVGKVLNLIGCTELTSLPADLKIGTRIVGSHPETKEQWQKIYDRMKANRKTSGLRKLKVL